MALCVFAVIRLKEAPKRLDRKSRFYGSHLDAAWIVLGMIALVMITLLVYRGAQINTDPASSPSTTRGGPSPRRPSARSSTRSAPA